MKTYYVYILANRRAGTLYVGVTSNLLQRTFAHKNDVVEGFTKEYRVHRLVYFEETNDVMTAIEREKQLKWWRRAWKVALIERSNPTWNDLYDILID